MKEIDFRKMQESMADAAKMAPEIAKMLKAIYDAFVIAGFNPQQAIYMTSQLLKQAPTIHVNLTDQGE
jgi:hypothetical protein